MKVALFTKKFTTRTGNERVATQIATRLTRAGHDVKVYCQKFDATVEGLIADSNLIRLRGLSFDPTLSMWTFSKQAKRAVVELGNSSSGHLILGFNHTVIHDVYRLGGGTHKGFMESTQFGGRSGGPIVNRMAQNLEIQRLTDPRCEAYIVPSQKVREELIHYYKVDEAKIHTIYNGVDLENFRPEPNDEKNRQIRSQWGIDSSDKVAIFIGQDLRIKGFEQAVAATQKVGCRLVYVGKAHRPSQLAPHVVWAGEHRDVADYLRACDALILPSFYESFSNVTLEALACGLAPIITKQVGASELLVKSALETLVTESPHNIDHLAASLDYAFSNQDSLAAECRAIAEQYSVEKFYGRFEEVLSRVYERNH